MKRTAIRKAAARKSTLPEKKARRRLRAKAGRGKKNPATAKRGLVRILKSAPRKAFPASLKPMLSTLVDKPVDEPGWICEVKWDGYRALGFCKKGKVELRSRNDKSFNEKFYPITEALAAWKVNVVVDGEIVVADKRGVSDFGALQGWRSEADGDLLYYLFDVLWYEGHDLTSLPLLERKRVLETIVPRSDILMVSNYFDAPGTDFFATAREMGLEGMIAKRADSIYEPGKRTTHWLKIKANKRQEMVIGGYTVNEGSDKLFSALLLGVYEGDAFVYTGKVGTGFNRNMQEEMMKLFRPLVAKKAPFTFVPDVNKPSRFRPNPPKATATWLRPELVCEVSFAGITSDGILRHPSFEGLRSDKNAKQVFREQEKSTRRALMQEKKVAGKAIVARAAARERRTFLNPKDETQVREINGHELKFTNLSKYYWPKEKITKRDLLNYYYQVAPYILPYLKDRPQSMLRHPEGITGFSFYYKNVKGKAPGWVSTYGYHSEADGEDREYLVARDEASLLYMVSLGCIEMNPWHSRVQREDYPDWCIIDLDPGKTSTFGQVIEVAQATHEVLDELGIASYPKTSGSSGMHIYIPLGARYTYEESKEFARVIARAVHARLPSITSIERAVKDRKGKLYVDFLQNRPHATVSAPYSARPKPGAPVSMPLHWHEVKNGLQITDFTIHNAMDRIKQEGDLFKPVLGKGVNLHKIGARR
jgi:bifunctional non-homologous end joining protein LigD